MLILCSLYQQKHWASAQVQKLSCFYQFLQQEAVDNIFSGLLTFKEVKFNPCWGELQYK